MPRLFIDICARYLNLTNSLHPDVLQVAWKTYLYGPGFVSDDVLDSGVESYTERHGPFDAVATERVEWDLGAILEGHFRGSSSRSGNFVVDASN